MGSVRLLLIGKDPKIIDQVTQILRSCGANLYFVATTLEQAVQSIHEHFPDLILIDDQYNDDMIGIEAALSCYFHLTVPVLHLADFLDTSVLGRSHTAHLCGFDATPIRKTELCEALEFSLSKPADNPKAGPSQPRFATI